jgi:integrase
MPSNKLTDNTCKRAAPGPKPRKLADGHGLHLYIAPSGHKGWRCSYRFEGKEQLATFGAYPLVSLAQARQACHELREKLARGENPKADAAPPPKPRDLLLMHQAWEDYWDNQRKDVGARYRQHARRALEMHLHKLRELPVAELTREALLEQLNAMNKQELFVYVRKVRQWVSQMLDWCVEQGKCKENVAKLIDPKKAFGRRRVTALAALKLGDVRGLMERLSFEDEIQSVLACKLLALTWVRTGELRMMEWDEIDGNLWRIPEGKMKRQHDHLVPLSRQAMEIIEKLRLRARGSKYVFPNDRRIDRPMSENAVLYLLHRIGYKGEMTGHGWRSVGSTWANEEGYDDDAIERQLAHVPEDKVRSTYNRAMYLKKRREIMQKWADWLDDPDTSSLEG